MQVLKNVRLWSCCPFAFENGLGASQPLASSLGLWGARSVSVCQASNDRGPLERMAAFLEPPVRLRNGAGELAWCTFCQWGTQVPSGGWLPGSQSRWGGCVWVITTVLPSGAVSERPSTVQESLLLSGHYKIKTRRSEEDRHMKSGTKPSAYWWQAVGLEGRIRPCPCPWWGEGRGGPANNLQKVWSDKGPQVLCWRPNPCTSMGPYLERVFT